MGMKKCSIHDVGKTVRKPTRLCYVINKFLIYTKQ